MAVPVVIFVACLSAGVFASSNWLPNLAAGSAGGLAFFAVSGLIGGALAVVGLRVYMIVEETHNGTSGFLNRDVVANDLTDMLWEAGLLLGLAVTVYLLAPAATAATAEASPPPTTPSA
jgi:hypothetical protein